MTLGFGEFRSLLDLHILNARIYFLLWHFAKLLDSKTTSTSILACASAGSLILNYELCTAEIILAQQPVA
jgi:hypothetical protein